MTTELRNPRAQGAPPSYHSPSVTDRRLDRDLPQPTLNVAYITSKYPLFSETFIYEEVLALRRMGVGTTLFALRPTGEQSHDFSRDLDETVEFVSPVFSLSNLRAHLKFCTRASYWNTLRLIVGDNWASPMPLLKNLYAFSKGVAWAERLDRAPSFGHLHAHWATMPTTTAWVAAELLDIPFSFTAHAWDIFKGPSMLRRKLRSAALAVTISEYNRRYLSEIGGSEAAPVEVARCGLRLERFPFEMPKTPARRFEIVSAARLVPKKGLTYLIDACALLRARGVELRLRVVGDGPERQHLETRIAEHQLADCVELTGSVLHEDLVPLLRTGDAFVLPCVETSDGNRDGIPVALMEAMALGIPAVSTRISGISELVEHDVTGLLARPGDANELADQIERLIGSPDLARYLAEAGRLRIEAEYDISQNVLQKAKLLRFSQSALNPRVAVHV